MSDSLDQMPPHNKDAERAILATCFRDNRQIPEAMRLLRADDFYVYAHQKIYEAIVALGDKGRRVDAVTVGEWLQKAKALQEVGGGPYIGDVIAKAPNAHIEHYAEIVRDHATARSLLHASAEIALSANSPTGPMCEMLAGAERLITSISERGVVSDTVDMQTALREAWNRIEMRRNKGGAQGVMTGFMDLDAILSGFQDG